MSTLENADYINAYRFGFGLNTARGEKFDPHAELGRTPDDGKTAMSGMEAALSEHFKTGGVVRKLKKNKQADEYQKQKQDKARAAQLLDAQRNHQRLLDAVNSDTPFLRRLAAFWINHFTVSRLPVSVCTFARDSPVTALSNPSVYPPDVRPVIFAAPKMVVASGTSA